MPACIWISYIYIYINSKTLQLFSHQLYLEAAHLGEELVVKRIHRLDGSKVCQFQPSSDRSFQVDVGEEGGNLEQGKMEESLNDSGHQFENAPAFFPPVVFGSCTSW